MAFTASEVVAFLGDQVQITDDQVFMTGRLTGVRYHPENTEDFLIDFDNGQAITGSTVVSLVAAPPQE